jgi:hypothetical protein
MYGPTCAGIYTKRRNNPYAIAPDFAPRAFKSQQPVKKITRAGYNFASSKKDKKETDKIKEADVGSHDSGTPWNFKEMPDRETDGTNNNNKERKGAGEIKKENAPFAAHTSTCQASTSSKR